MRRLLNGRLNLEQLPCQIHLDKSLQKAAKMTLTGRKFCPLAYCKGAKAHFIFVQFKHATPTVTVYFQNSAPGFGIPQRDIALELLGKFIRDKWTKVKKVEFVEQECELQKDEECAVHTLNNCAKAMKHPETAWTRAKMLAHIEEEIASFNP